MNDTLDALTDFDAFAERRREALPPTDIRSQMACYSFNGITGRYEVVRGLYGKKVIARFKTLRETQTFVNEHNAKLSA